MSEQRGTKEHPFVEASDALPLLGCTAALRTGAALEPAGKEGAARLMARLMRRTGAGRTATETDELLDSLGSSLGAEVSTSTLTFHGGAIVRSAERFIQVMSEVIAAPEFHQDEFERLVQEARGELVEGLDNDRSLVRRWFRRSLFADHPYGRPSAGTLESLARIELDDLRQLYEKLVTRDNLIFGFAGDIEGTQATQFAEQIAQGLAGGRSSDDVPAPTGPRGRKLVIVDKPERTQTQILIGGLGTHPRDADHTALYVANTIFGGTFTARLCQEVRAKRGWSYGAYSSLPFDRERQAFSMWTFPKADDAAPCIELQLALLETFRNVGITTEELEWAKKYLCRSHAFSIDTAGKRMGLRVDSVLYDLPEGYYEKYTERVQNVTLDEVNEAIRKRIPFEDLVIAVVGTEADIGARVRGAIPELAEVEVIPFDRPD